jgi:hypothetical protein
VQHTLTHPVPDIGYNPYDSVAFSTDGKAVIVRGRFKIIEVVGSWDLTTTAQPQYAESTSAHEKARAFDDLHAAEQRDVGLPAPDYFLEDGSPWIQLANGQEEPKDICWLPKERRGKMTYSGTKVCVGGRGGAITTLDFSPVGLLQ